LYSCADELGATKLCLGHHLDDAAETLFLNLVHQGQLKAMPVRRHVVSFRFIILKKN
jgi:tRNA 2-thiocytidine biosynthesis protein TtcA